MNVFRLTKLSNLKENSKIIFILNGSARHFSKKMNVPQKSQQK